MVALRQGKTAMVASRLEEANGSRQLVSWHCCWSSCWSKLALELVLSAARHDLEAAIAEAVREGVVLWGIWLVGLRCYPLVADGYHRVF